MQFEREFEREDAATLERLRAKYQTGPGAAADAQAASGGLQSSADPGSADGSLASACVCQECQGSGVVTEVYEHRRMESTCGHCQGEGILTMGRASSKPAAGSAAAAAAALQRPKAGGVSGSNPSGSSSTQPAGRATTTGHHRVQKQVSKLQARIEQLAQEAADAQVALDVDAASPGRRALQLELVRQLHAHLEQLRGMRNAKVQQLQLACAPVGG